MPQMLCNPKTKRFEIENREVELGDELKVYIEKLDSDYYGLVTLDESENFILLVEISGEETLQFDLSEFESAELIG